MNKKIITVTIITLIVLLQMNLNGENDKRKKQAIADRLYEIELMGGDQLGYARDILQHLERSDRIRPSAYRGNAFDDVDRLNSGGGPIDIYSTFQGGLAVRELTQLDTIRPPDDVMREIDISAIRAPEIRNCQYSQFLKNRVFKLYSIDTCIPSSFYSIHFHNLIKAFDTFKYIDDVLGSVYRRFIPSSTEFIVREKLMMQLALRSKDDSPYFYMAAVDEVAITGSDPFLIEGSDISLIIKPVRPADITQAINSMRRYFRDRYSASEKEIKVNGISINHLYTPDRRIWSAFSVLQNGTIIISNSVKAVIIIAETAMGKKESLAEMDDYRYIRTVFPAGKSAEEGFLYLSDRFMRYMISPSLKIREARRMSEAMRISLLEKYMIFHYQTTGSIPLSIEEVLKSAGGYSLNENRKRELQSIKNNPFYGRALLLDNSIKSKWELFTAELTKSSQASKNTRAKKSKKRKSSGHDGFITSLRLFYKNITGSQAYSPSEVFSLIDSIDKSGGQNTRIFNGLSLIKGTFSVESDLYGRIGFMVPNIEFDIDKVSKREYEEYKRFADSYGNSWKNYFNSAGTRFWTGGPFITETFLIPCSDNSGYILLSDLCGGEPAELHVEDRMKGEIFSLFCKINPRVLQQHLNSSELITSVFPDRIKNLDEILSGEIQLHIKDAATLSDFDSGIITNYLISGHLDISEVLSGYMAWAFSHPIRLAVAVRNINAGHLLINYIKRALTGQINNYTRSEYYSFRYWNCEVNVIKLTIFGSLTIRFYIVLRDNLVHIATSENHIKDILQFYPTSRSTARGNLIAIYRPSEINSEKDNYKISIIENGLAKSMANFGTIQLLSDIFPNSSARELPILAYRNFGFMPVCPLGGEYYKDYGSGEIRNSVFGSRSSPLLKYSESGTGTIQTYLKNFFDSREIRFELEYTRNGLISRIKTR